jgi:geranylgeranyl diphosphate synthase type II
VLRTPEEHRALVEADLDDLALTPELGALTDAMRYALPGGKRIRAVLCLATTEAAGGDAEVALPAAAALELVQAFSLVHDDLPALDDDDVRRGRPSAHVRFGEATALLAGDALFAEAVRLALAYRTPAIAREIVRASLAMIGGQYLDVVIGDADAAELNRLKTGALFDAAIACGLWAAELPEREHAPWREFAVELGPLYQFVDDILDGDGYAAAHGETAARAAADAAATRARARLEAIPAETGVLGEIVAGLAARTS